MMNNKFKSPATRRTSSQSPYQRPSGSNTARFTDPLDYSGDAGNFFANVENRPIFRTPAAVPPHNYGPTEADDAPLFQPFYRHDVYGQSSGFNSLQHPGFPQDKVNASPQPSYERNIPSFNERNIPSFNERNMPSFNERNIPSFNERNIPSFNERNIPSFSNPDPQMLTRPHAAAVSVSDEGAFYGYKRGNSMVATSNEMSPSVPSSPIFMNFHQERDSTPERRSYGTPSSQPESGFGSLPLRPRRDVYSTVYPESGFVKSDSDALIQTPPSYSLSTATAAPSTSTSVKATPSKSSKIKEETETSKDTVKRRQNSKTVVMAFSGSTDKTKKWQKTAEIPEKELLFEVIAPLVAVRQGGHRTVKTLLLREHGKPTQQWDFFEIDRPLPPIQKGQLVRCVGRLVNKHKLQAFSVRVASEEEKSQLLRLGFISQRIINGLGITAS